MELAKAAKLARSLMDDWGLQGWSFGWDSARRRIGHSVHAPYRRITLSKPLTLINPESVIEDTIRHEIAHAKAGYKAGHGPTWKAWAIKVGADPKSKASINMAESPYKLVCAQGHEFPRYRRVKRVSNYSCSKCSPHYDPKYKLKLVRNG